MPTMQETKPAPKPPAPKPPVPVVKPTPKPMPKPPMPAPKPMPTPPMPAPKPMPKPPMPAPKPKPPIPMHYEDVMLGLSDTLCMEMSGPACALGGKMCGFLDEMGASPHTYCDEMTQYCNAHDANKRAPTLDADAKFCMTLKASETGCAFAESICSVSDMKGNSFCKRAQDQCKWK